MMEAGPSAPTWPLYELTGVDEGWEDGLVAFLSRLHQHPEWTSGRQDSHQICNHTNKPEQGMMGNKQVFSVVPANAALTVNSEDPTSTSASTAGVSLLPSTGMLM